MATPVLYEPVRRVRPILWWLLLGALTAFLIYTVIDERATDQRHLVTVERRVASLESTQDSLCYYVALLEARAERMHQLLLAMLDVPMSSPADVARFLPNPTNVGCPVERRRDP